MSALDPFVIVRYLFQGSPHARQWSEVLGKSANAAKTRRVGWGRPWDSAGYSTLNYDEQAQSFFARATRQLGASLTFDCGSNTTCCFITIHGSLIRNATCRRGITPGPGFIVQRYFRYAEQQTRCLSISPSRRGCIRRS